MTESECDIPDFLKKRFIKNYTLQEQFTFNTFSEMAGKIQCYHEKENKKIPSEQGVSLLFKKSRRVTSKRGYMFIYLQTVSNLKLKQI